MVPRIRLRPTYSSVTSTLALFVALSGGAYAAARLPANSVGSRQIKNNAVVRAKLRANAVNSSKVAANALKGADIDEASLAKVPSAAAADSAVHANAAAALDRLTYKVAGATAPAQSFGTATVACDPGQHVTGGGVRADDPIAEILVDSFPDAGNTAWTGRVWNGSDAGTPATGFTVYAICASAQTIG
jgi:hypothetical protein